MSVSRWAAPVAFVNVGMLVAGASWMPLRGDYAAAVLALVGAAGWLVAGLRAMELERAARGPAEPSQ